MPRKFRPEIQLLRAIAVATVVVYHLNPKWLPGGFIGVDVFFVISGYLITSHMLGEVANKGKISLLGFWANRARRILPAATVTIIVTAIASCFFLPATQLTATAWQGIASALYFQNFALAAKSVDYLTQQAADTPFQHFWSLSVEEQFYVVWPLLVILACWIALLLQHRHPTDEIRRLRRFRAIVLAAFSVVVIASFVYSAVSVSHGDPAAYFVTPARFWELGVGGVLACVLRDPQRWPLLRNLLALAGVATIVLACIFYTGNMPFPGIAALAPTLGCVAVIVAGRTRGIGSLTPIVDFRPVQVLGNWSYSLYLWHFPVIVFFVTVTGHHAGWRSAPGLLVGSLALAAASYYFVEQPVRINGLLKRHRWLTIEAAITAMAVAAGIAVIPQGVYAKSVENDKQETSRLAVGATPGLGYGSLERSSFEPYAPGHDDAIIPLPAEARSDQPKFPCKGVPVGAESPHTEPCVVANPDGKKTMVVVGDSHAAMWIPALTQAYDRTDLKIVAIIHNSCPFNLSPRRYETGSVLQCTEPNKETLRKILDMRPDRALVTNLAVTDMERHGDEKAPGTWGYEQVLRPMKDAGIAVTALHDAPQPPGGESVADCVSSHEDDVNKCGFPRSESLEDEHTNTALKAAAKRVGGIHFAKPTELFCTTDTCPAVIGSVLVYRDANHVSATYMRTISREAKALLESGPQNTHG